MLTEEDIITHEYSYKNQKDTKNFRVWQNDDTNHLIKIFVKNSRKFVENHSKIFHRNSLDVEN